MTNGATSASQETERIIAGLHGLRQFTGAPEAFWQTFLSSAAQLAGARRATVLARLDGDARWSVSVSWPPPSGPVALPSEATLARSHVVADAALAFGHSSERAPGGEGALVGIRLEVGAGQPAAVMVLEVEDAPVEALTSSILLMRFLADIPATYQKERALSQATGDVVRFAEALDLMVLLNEDKRFVKAAMTLVNELASRYRCARVSLGWRRGDYVRSVAISHLERFEGKTGAVQALEAAMEEAADQDEEIVVPARARGAVVRAHEEYARLAGTGAVLSLPVRLDGEPVGVVTCERQDGAFSDEEAATLRLLCDQSARRLGDLARADRWIGAKLADALIGALKRFFGVEHTLAKALGVLAAALAWYLAFGTLAYRIEGSFILKTDDLVYLPAPFDGYIEDVKVGIGDAVKEGDVLLALDARELELEESAVTAEISRQRREAEKALARSALADMKIAQAQAAQAEARLAKVRYHLSNAKLKAPMSGLIVEGDLKKMLGAPVRRGDIMFKIARVERMYAEIDVNERDVHEVSAGRTGEVSFVSRPHAAFPIAVERVDPAATVREGSNEFVVRARLTGEHQPWWRPGMSGVAKIDAGERNVAWVLTHRTVDYLRLLMWW